MKILPVLGLLLSLVSPAAADYKITADPGGFLVQYEAKYERLKKDGTHVVIDGYCASACTLLLGIISRSNVCVTPNSVLGFHSASKGGVHDKEGTKWMWSFYPSKIKTFLRAHGFNGGRGQEHQDVIWYRAVNYYKRCVNG